MSGRNTLPDMRTRTPFGERLYLARTYAKLSQTQLCKLAGVSQGNLGELEWNGDGSMAAVRLAVACGVRPEWLAEGIGDMVDADAWPFELVTRDEILALEPRHLQMVEGAMLATLERIHSPNTEDVEAFAHAHTSKSRKSVRRKAA